MTLLRYFANGELVFAGAHEDLVILRAATGRCERIETLGTWVGATEDIADATEDQHARLEDGDVLLLYTDGVIEAANAAGEQYGIERLCATLEAASGAPVAEIRDRLLASVQEFLAVQDDDIALARGSPHPRPPCDYRERGTRNRSRAARARSRAGRLDDRRARRALLADRSAGSASAQGLRRRADRARVGRDRWLARSARFRGTWASS